MLFYGAKRDVGKALRSTKQVPLFQLGLQLRRGRPGKVSCWSPDSILVRFPFINFHRLHIAIKTIKGTQVLWVRVCKLITILKVCFIQLFCRFFLHFAMHLKLIKTNNVAHTTGLFMSRSKPRRVRLLLMRIQFVQKEESSLHRQHIATCTQGRKLMCNNVHKQKVYCSP